MTSHARNAEFTPLDWIDSEDLPALEYGVARRGDREILVGYLDLSLFPTVEELQREIGERDIPPAPCHKASGLQQTVFWKWLANGIFNAIKLTG